MFKNYDDIKNEYSIIRHKNLRKYEEKKAEIYAKFPKLKEIDSSIIEAKMNDICSIFNDNHSIENIEGIMKKLDEDRKKYLKDNGIEDGYLDVKYDCERCKDTGYIDGKKCSCFLNKEIELFNTISRFDEIAKDCTFSNVNMDYYNQSDEVAASGKPYRDQIRLIFENIADHLKHIDEKGFNALFLGPTGTGKTFLACCIGNEFLKKKKSVLFITANQLIDSYFVDDEEGQLEDYALACDLLILDDLGSECTQEFFVSKLLNIITTRFERNKSTIITTVNKGNVLKSKYGDSIVSRIFSQYTNYGLQGKDLRRLKYASIERPNK